MIIITGGIDQQAQFQEVSDCFFLYNNENADFLRIRLPNLQQARFGHNVIHYKDHLFVINGVRTAKNS